MSWFKRTLLKPLKTPEQIWAEKHPYGEEGTIDYWIEAMKRAYVLGEVRAQGELARLAALPGSNPPMSWLDFPDWFRTLWLHQLAPWNGDSHQLAMPY